MNISQIEQKGKGKLLIGRLTRSQRNALISALNAHDAGAEWLPSGNNVYKVATIRVLESHALVELGNGFKLTVKGKAIASELRQRALVAKGGKRS